MHQRQTRLEALEQRTHSVARQLRWWRSRSDPMTYAAAGLLAVAVCLTGLLVAAPAGAQPPPVPIPTPEPLALTGYCAFPVLVTYSAFSEFVIQATTASDGTTTVKIAGYVETTVTNLKNEKSVTYNTSGPGTVVLYPDGTVKSADIAGPNLLWTLPELSFPGVPAISYTTGHVTFEVNPEGLTTSYTLTGRQTDVCAMLADP
jgi:hypothetical protein